MLLFFSPYSFLYFFVYLALTFMLISLTDFVTFWFVMELLMLVFIGLSFSLISHSMSQLIVYFFVQSLASFIILVSYLTGSSSLLTLSLFAKLAVFPFSFWFIYAAMSLPSLTFFLICTMQKLPPLVMLGTFLVRIESFWFWGCAITTVALSGLLMLGSHDLRFLLVASSVGTNGWLLLAQSSGVCTLATYFAVYSVLLALVLGNTPFHHKHVPPSRSSVLHGFSLVALSGLPPSPLFFANLFVILSLGSSSSLLLAVFLLLSTCMVVSYVIFCINLIVFNASSHIIIL